MHEGPARPLSHLGIRTCRSWGALHRTICQATGTSHVSKRKYTRTMPHGRLLVCPLMHPPPASLAQCQVLTAAGPSDSTQRLLDALTCLVSVVAAWLIKAPADPLSLCPRQLRNPDLDHRAWKPQGSPQGDCSPCLLVSLSRRAAFAAHNRHKGPFRSADARPRLDGRLQILADLPVRLP